jgi:glycosyltransferase involved in cell wall biosynthesis
MSEVIGCVIAYNEEMLLAQCLESIVDKVDRLIVVEGRIEHFPGDSHTSDDNTIAIAEDYGATVVTNNKAWSDEATMRNQYLLGQEDDWYICIDADEKCMTPLPAIKQFPKDAYAYAIKSWMVGVDNYIWRPRIFRHVGVMQYRSIHDALFSDDKLISRPQDVPKLYSVWFAHYQMVRDELRRKQKTEYFKTGYAHEPEYRKKWKMFNRAEDVK